ncbi:MAG: hypothetical protein PHP98_08545 [Kiritimatiellae bacterium]|nr:hypothetical protein [Kiritimatiellia bacterium]
MAPIRIDKPTEPIMNNWGLKNPFIPLADMALSYLFASAAVKPGYCARTAAGTLSPPRR